MTQEARVFTKYRAEIRGIQRKVKNIWVLKGILRFDDKGYNVNGCFQEQIW